MLNVLQLPPTITHSLTFLNYMRRFTLSIIQCLLSLTGLLAVIRLQTGSVFSYSLLHTELCPSAQKRLTLNRKRKAFELKSKQFSFKEAPRDKLGRGRVLLFCYNFGRNFFGIHCAKKPKVRHTSYFARHIKISAVNQTKKNGQSAHCLTWSKKSCRSFSGLGSYFCNKVLIQIFSLFLLILIMPTNLLYSCTPCEIANVPSAIFIKMYTMRVGIIR